MTKSQNTKNEQQNDLCITSEQLKEEYEKECKRADELEDSYWKSEKENQKLKEEVSRESYKVSEAYCLVEELKELLKECQHILKEQNFYRNTPIEKDMIYRTRCLKKQELLTKIDEVIK